MQERTVDKIVITAEGTIVFNVDGTSEILLPNTLSIIVNGQEIDISVIIPLIQEYQRS